MIVGFVELTQEADDPGHDARAEGHQNRTLRGSGGSSSTPMSLRMRGGSSRRRRSVWRRRWTAFNPSTKCMKALIVSMAILLSPVRRTGCPPSGLDYGAVVTFNPTKSNDDFIQGN
jgi:hypothetical protein